MYHNAVSRSKQIESIWACGARSQYQLSLESNSLDDKATYTNDKHMAIGKKKPPQRVTTDPNKTVRHVTS